MTDLECLKQAIKDYKCACKLFNGKDYQECVELCETKKLDIFNLDDELFDINFGACVFTIMNENGKAKVNGSSIDVWNDQECYTIVECESIANIRKEISNGKEKSLCL